MTDTRRFLLFAGETYYAKGGIQDFRGAYETLEAAVAAGNRLLDGGDRTPRDFAIEWFHVAEARGADIVEFVVVHEHGRPHS